MAKAILNQTKLPEVLPPGSPARAKLKSNLEPKRVHGGLPSVKKRKTTRPFSPSSPVHLVLKASRAKGVWSLLHRKNRARIESMIFVYAKRFHVRVYRAAVLGNRLHLLVKAKEKKNLSDFLRVLAGRIAVVVTGAKKFVKRVGKFWDYLTWSKLIQWGHEFFEVRKYVAADVFKEDAKITDTMKTVEEWNFSAEALLRPTPE